MSPVYLQGKEVNYKIKIGILTLGYRNTPKTGNPDNVKGLRFMDGVKTAGKFVPNLREMADIVVILSHDPSFL